MRRISSNYPRVAAALTLVLLILGALPGTARTIAVPEDVATIAAAMNAANPGDIILVGCGTYREANIQVKSGVSLWSGTLQPDCTVIDAEGRGRVLAFDGCDSTTAVVGFTLRGGVTEGDGGAIVTRDATPRISRCVLRDNQARRGGGLAVQGPRAPRLEDCVIVANEASLQGGGVFWNTDASGRLTRCTLEGNHALAGGGIACLRGDRLRLTEVNILSNQAAGSGGGLWNGQGSAQLVRCVIARNHAGLAGGAVTCRDGRPGLTSCTLVDNDAGAGAGGVLVRGGSPRFERTIVAFNGATAAVVETGGQITLTNCNVFGHPDGDWTGPLAAQAGRDANFSADPLFCSRDRGLYELSARSPCLRVNRPGGIRVGARGRGCD